MVGLSNLIKVYLIVFTVGVLSVLGLAGALQSAEHIGYFDALYSTAMSAMLVGPTINITNGQGQVITILSVIDGLIMIEFSVGAVVYLVHTWIEGKDRRSASRAAVKDVEVDMAKDAKGTDADSR